MASVAASESVETVQVFFTAEQTAHFLNLTKHELYQLRRNGGGPPFCMWGVRVRYPVEGLAECARSQPRFSTRAEAYAANRERGAAAEKQRDAAAHARKTRHPRKESIEATDS